MIEVATVHAAMEAASGNLAQAAATLGVTKLRLKDIILNDAGLKARWRVAGVRGTGAPGVESLIHRPPPPETITVNGEKLTKADAEKIAKAADEEDAAVRSGLLKLGIKGSNLEMVLAMQQMQRKHFVTCIQIVGGGVTLQAVNVMAEIDKISERLADAALPLEEQHMLREDRRGLLDILGRFKDKVDKSALIQAMVKKAEAEAKGGGKGKPGKPGFGVLVRGDKVEIHEHHEHPPAE